MSAEPFTGDESPVEILTKQVENLGYTLHHFPDPTDGEAYRVGITGVGKLPRGCSYLWRSEPAQRAAFRCILEAAREGLPRVAVPE